MQKQSMACESDSAHIINYKRMLIMQLDQTQTSGGWWRRLHPDYQSGC